MNYLIGCGGVGSVLAPTFCKLVDPENITLIDGDTIERKNLDRQMFSEADIGRNKAGALAERHRCTAFPEWFSRGKWRFKRGDVLLVLVDNHSARREALETCDEDGCQAIFAANETYSSSAYYYTRKWRGTTLDPRIYYPELNTDTTDDPRAASIGCTGEAQRQRPQLATANGMAASLALHLYVLWVLKAPRLDRELIPSLPFRLLANLSRLETHLIRDFAKESGSTSARQPRLQSVP